MILLSYILSIETMSEIFAIQFRIQEQDNILHAISAKTRSNINTPEKSVVKMPASLENLQLIFATNIVTRAYETLINNLNHIETTSFSSSEMEDVMTRKQLLLKITTDYDYQKDPQYLQIFSILHYKIKERHVIQCARQYIEKFIK